MAANVNLTPISPVSVDAATSGTPGARSATSSSTPAPTAFSSILHDDHAAAAADSAAGTEHGEAASSETRKHTRRENSAQPNVTAVAGLPIPGAGSTNPARNSGPETASGKPGLDAIDTANGANPQRLLTAGNAGPRGGTDGAQDNAIAQRPADGRATSAKTPNHPVGSLGDKATYAAAAGGGQQLGIEPAADHDLPPQPSAASIAPAPTTGAVQLPGSVTPLPPAAPTSGDSNPRIPAGETASTTSQRVLAAMNARPAAATLATSATADSTRAASALEGKGSKGSDPPADGRRSEAGTDTPAAQSAAMAQSAAPMGPLQFPTAIAPASVGPRRKGDPSLQSLAAAGVNGSALLSGAVPSASQLTTVASQLGTPQFAQEVAQQAASLAQSGGSQLTLQVNPPQLGHVQLLVTSQNHVVQVAFVAQTPQGAQALQQSLPLLQSALAQQGLSLGQASVAQQGFQNRQSRRDGATPRAVAATGAPPIVASSATATRTPAGLVDAFA